MKHTRRHARTCKGKIRFRSMDEVKRVLSAARARDKRGEERGKAPVRYYECPDCKGWHLTSRRTW